MRGPGRWTVKKLAWRRKPMNDTGAISTSFATESGKSVENTIYIFYGTVVARGFIPLQEVGHKTCF